MNLRDTKKIIKNSNTIYVAGHRNPDGDSIGSSFAMYFALKQMGKDVSVILDKHSFIFDFLPSINEAKKCIEEDSIDLLIVTDVSDLNRTILSPEDLKKAKHILRIDHHYGLLEINKGDVVDPTAPAACEIMYDVLKYLKVNIDKTIATYLYSGLLTDTGSFNYSTTTAKTYEIAAKLISTGIDFSSICKHLNDTMKESKLYLIKETIDRMEVYENGKIRYSYIDYDTINKLGIDEEDAEGMTNYLRRVVGTDIAIYVRGKANGTFKVSLRSSEKVDVSKIAIHFLGGGHKRAAGYSMDINKSLEENKKDLLDFALNELRSEL